MTESRPSAEAIATFQQGLARFWQPVAAVEQVTGQPLAVELLGRSLVLALLDGEVVAFDDLCRHFGAALSVGQVIEGRQLRCAYHGWSYDAGGRCVDIPARRGLPIPREARVAKYPAAEAYGLVWVCLAGEPAAGLPAYPEFADGRYAKTPIRVYEPWRASATRIVMATLDDTHFPWVHPGTLGDPAHPEPPDHVVDQADDHLVTTYSIKQPANVSLGSGAGVAGLETVRYTNHVWPTTVRLVKKAPGGNFVLFQAMQPMDYDRTRIFLQVARDFDLDPEHHRTYVEFEDVVQSQDRPIVESQRPWLLPPLSSRLMLYVRPADLPLIAFQKWMEELGLPQI